MTVDKASAFLSGAKPIPFVDSEKADYLHIGYDPKRDAAATGSGGACERGEKEERARKKEVKTVTRAEAATQKRLWDERRAEVAAQKRLCNAAVEEARKRLQLREFLQFWTSSFILMSVPDQPSPLIVGNGVSGYKGVTKSGGKRQVKIIIDKDKWGDSIAKSLGLFNSPEEAAGIYIRAEFLFEQTKREMGLS